LHPARFRPGPTFCCVILFAAFSQTLAAKTLCVNPTGSNSCYAKIQLAVNAASNNDVINVAAGTYAEDVVIGKPLSLIGSGPDRSIIDATNLAKRYLAGRLQQPRTSKCDR
jgi:pectin methylesterase-like acyl-CoA thioesterase